MNLTRRDFLAELTAALCSASGMKHLFLVAVFSVLFILPAPAFAADPRGDNPDAKPLTPREQLAKFHVPPGFEVQLVAAEPEIQKPINLNFDAQGRLWVTGSELYPWPAATDAAGQPIPNFAKAYAEITDAFHSKGKAPEIASEGRDSVRILSDFDENGRAKKVIVFADKLNIPSGIEPLPRKPGAKGDSAIVYSIPNIWLMTDTTGSGHADKREILYGPFGFLDTHGGASSFIYWIDGWIYGTHGFRNHSEVRDRSGRVTVFDSGNTFRFRPDGSKIEHFTHGQTNPFGLAFDPLGNLYSADSHSKPVYLLLRGGYYEGIGKQHDGLGFAPCITDDDHGSSAIGGIAYYADDKWPEEFRGNLFNGNPVTRRVNRDKLEWHGSTPRAIRQPDFVTCDDPWFRPVNLKLGPDGALYIADFYNAIIGHYEVPLTDPHRDHTHGRIWRVVYVGEKKPMGGEATVPGSARAPRAGEGASPSRTSETASKESDHAIEKNAPQEVRRGEAPRPAREARALPDLSRLDAKALVEKLGDPNLEVRRLATNELVDRIGQSAATGMRDRLLHLRVGSAVVSGLWALERLGSLDEELLFAAQMGDSGERVLGATKVLGARVETGGSGLPARGDGPDGLDRLREKVYESESAIARAAVEGLRLAPSIQNLRTLLMKWEGPQEGDTAMIYSVRLALKAQLEKPGVYAEIKRRKFIDDGKPAIDGLRDPRFAEDDWVKLSEVSPAVNTPESADFLLAHLERTKFAVPRAGEFLKHAALHIDEKKLPALFALVEKLGDAPLMQRLAAADALNDAARKRGFHFPESTAAWIDHTLLDALTSPDEATLKRALESVRETKLDAKLSPLAAIAADTKRPTVLRVAALNALANLEPGIDTLVAALNDPGDIAVRKCAAELLGQRGGDKTAAASLAALPAAPSELGNILAVVLAKTDQSAARLLDLVESGKVSATVLRGKFFAAVMEARPPELRERVAKLIRDLPSEDARLDALIAQRAKAFTDARPDPKHGVQVFQQTCAICHRFRNEGGNVGPNLDGVSARGVQRLCEDIIDPNRNVDPAFRITTLTLENGEQVTGMVQREEGGNLFVRDVAGAETMVAKTRVKTRAQSNLSLMPPGFGEALKPGDFNDLLSYLLNPPPK